MFRYNVRRLNRVRLGLCVVAGLSLVPESLAQWNYQQVWNDELPAVRSRVDLCAASPQASPVIAYDDFLITVSDVIENGGPITIDKIEWWGWLSSSATEELPEFRIAIYENEAGCRPGALIGFTCCYPRINYSGIDCEGKYVYEFTKNSVNLGPLGPGRYWIAISEVEANSPTAGYDFKWSGHRKREGCAAVLIPGGPVRSRCDGERMDLAFKLEGK